MMLSLSGFLFELDYRSQSVSFPSFCGIASDCGYDGVELRDTQVSIESNKRLRAELLSIVKDHGLVVTCLTARNLPATGAARDEFFARSLDLCADMECGLLKILSDPNWCRRAAGIAAGLGGVALAANNHIRGPLETLRGTREFLDAVGHPNFGLLYDCLHLALKGQDYLGFAREIRPATRNILVHSARPIRPLESPDFIGDNGTRWKIALPDEPGVQDWRGVFAAFRSSGYDGLVTVIESGWPVGIREETARRCAELVRTFWRGEGK